MLQIHFMSVQHLTTEQFKDQIFDYTKEAEWKFKGSRPAFIDFYADWCGPCKMVSAVIDELAVELEGQVDFYKVDTEAEIELASVFQIQSIPSLLFIPLEGLPMMQMGALPKPHLRKAIEERLLTPAAPSES